MYGAFLVMHGELLSMDELDAFFSSMATIHFPFLTGLPFRHTMLLLLFGGGVTLQ